MKKPISPPLKRHNCQEVESTVMIIIKIENIRTVLNYGGSDFKVTSQKCEFQILIPNILIFLTVKINLREYEVINYIRVPTQHYSNYTVHNA